MSNEQNDIIEEDRQETKMGIPACIECQYSDCYVNTGCHCQCHPRTLGVKDESIRNKTLRRLEEAKTLFDLAFKRAVQAVKDAQEELTRPLTRDEILERDEEGF